MKVAIDVKVESLDSARVEDMVKEYFLKAEKVMKCYFQIRLCNY